MFPLGSVLFPSVLLPLHIFEERYRQLIRTVLDTDREFGVVLIERGSEVGGGDTRSSVGTLARVIEAEELPDGRWVLVSVGVERVRVADWLEDDPYPRARVQSWPDEPQVIDPSAWPDVEELLRRALALRAELGDAAAPATLELADDPVLRSHQASAAAPLGTLDRQRLLAAPGAADRLRLLDELLRDEVDVLRNLLESG
jgi:Lon protease-like protein